MHRIELKDSIDNEELLLGSSGPRIESEARRDDEEISL